MATTARGIRIRTHVPLTERERGEVRYMVEKLGYAHCDAVEVARETTAVMEATPWK